MTIGSKLARKQIYSLIDVVVDHACKIYKESTGNEMGPKAIKFIKAMLMTSVDLIDEAASDPEKINLAMIAQVAFKRALAIAEFTLDEKNAMQCGVALASLAIATVEYFGLMVAGTAGLATGVGTVPAAGAMISATAFYAYQSNELIQQCGDAFVASVEGRIAYRYQIQGKRALMANYSAHVCRAR